MLLARTAAAQPIIEVIPDDYPQERDVRTGVHAFLEPVPPSLQGPDALEIGGYQNYVPILLGPSVPDVATGVGALNNVVDGVLQMRDYNWKQRHGIEKRLASFDFRDAAKRAIERFDDGADWVLTAIDETSFYNPRDGTWRTSATARNRLGVNYTGGVLFLRFVFFISPDLRRVRLVVEMRLDVPSDKRRGSRINRKRRYEYVGPLQPVALRPWRQGEKESRVEEINSFFLSKLEQYPHNEDAYDRDRKLALANVEDSDTIPLADAFDEAWPDEKLEREFQAAGDAMVRVVRKDLAFIKRRPLVKGKKLLLDGLSPKGRSQKVWGRLFFHDGTHTVIQARDGDLYVLPTAN